ncbi:MAG: NADH:ubiquinone oxidoreductase [Rhodobacteraceae bacterium]|nr:NADH:ubiquinone oxidoreductase [Paracoccaceae bacterium]
MTEHNQIDRECLQKGGLWAFVVALAIGLLTWSFISFLAGVLVFVIIFAIGFGVAFSMCKNRGAGRDADIRAVDIARQEMGIAAPAPEDEPEVVAPAPEPAVEPAPKPEAASPPAHEEHVGQLGEGEAKPELLSAARGGKPDDLKKIKGVGPKLENELNAAGVFHFNQIAAWSVEEVAWADQHLVSFKGRVTRDSWVAQAIKLAKS